MPSESDELNESDDNISNAENDTAESSIEIRPDKAPIGFGPMALIAASEEQLSVIRNPLMMKKRCTA